MLQTASGEPGHPITNLLKEVEAEGPGFRRMLTSLPFTKHAQEQIQQAGMTWSPTRMLTAMGLATIPGLGIGAWFRFCSTGRDRHVLALVFASRSLSVVRHKRKQRLDQLEEQFPDSLDFLARSMRAGHAFSISLEMLGEEMADPLGQEFRALFNEQNLGAPLDMALRNLPSACRCSMSASLPRRCCCRSRPAAT